MLIPWPHLASLPAHDTGEIEIEGHAYPFHDGEIAFVLAAEPPCCRGCLPRDPAACIAIVPDRPIRPPAGRLRLAGTLVTEPAATGFRFTLRGARIVSGGLTGFTLSRRRALAAAPLLCLAAAAPAPQTVTPEAATPEAAALAIIADAATIDIHSHAGGINGVARVHNHAPFTPVAAPMRAGGMAVLCLAAVPDSPTHKVMPDHRIHPFREPEPGELYAFTQEALARVHALAEAQGLAIIDTPAALRAARAHSPGIVVATEGADFLEGQIDRLDEAVTRWRLRHVQLTHYRVNELGDIQTEAPVHGGLTDFGAAVIARCNRLGVVVDVAHGTFDLVRRAAATTTKPLVLSHTSLSRNPGPRSRTISAEHAKRIAGTGGVIGVWPPASVFPDLDAMAAGMARLASVVGTDHVALGTDMRGLVGPSALPDYDRLPGLVTALRKVGFTEDATRAVLGGNYLRVFEATMT